MEFTSLDGIEFVQDRKKQIRVYYQTTEDGVIRESSFEGNSWFVRGDGVVARAKKISPITVTRWRSGDETQIRVYFLDNDNNICECQGKHRAGRTTWRRAEVLKDKRDPNQPKVADGSQIAVARPDKDDMMLRIFYQERNAYTGAYHLSEFRYTKYRAKDRGFVPENELGEWGVKSILNRKATGPRGSHISAVSDRNSEEVHVFYHGDNNELMEVLWQFNSRWGEAQEVPVARNQLVPGAPITAVLYHANDTAEAQNTATQEIRVFTVMESSKGQITQLTRSEGDWKSMRTITVGSLYVGQPEQYSLIAAARGIKVGDDSPIYLFYQPSRKAIGLILVSSDLNDDAAKLAAQNVELLPEGLPTSRGMCGPTAPYRPANLESNDFILLCDNSSSMTLDTRRRTLEAAVRGLFKTAKKRFSVHPYEGPGWDTLTTETDVENALAAINYNLGGSALAPLQSRVLEPLKEKARQQTLNPTVVVVITDGDVGGVQGFVDTLMAFKSQLRAFGYSSSTVLFFLARVGQERSYDQDMATLKAMDVAKDVLYYSDNALELTEQQTGGNLNDRIGSVLSGLLTTMEAQENQIAATKARENGGTSGCQRAARELVDILTRNARPNAADLLAKLAEIGTALNLTEDEIRALESTISANATGLAGGTGNSGAVPYTPPALGSGPSVSSSSATGAPVPPVTGTGAPVPPGSGTGTGPSIPPASGGGSSVPSGSGIGSSIPPSDRGSSVPPSGTSAPAPTVTRTGACLVAPVSVPTVKEYWGHPLSFWREREASLIGNDAQRREGFLRYGIRHQMSDFSQVDAALKAMGEQPAPRY